MPLVLTGLDRMVSEGFARVRGQRVGLLCHPASVDRRLRHLTQLCVDAGVNVVRCFGPEHGIWADAQDMIPVESSVIEPITGAPVRSLYGSTVESLTPALDDLRDLDVLVIDLQDIGSRYYTYGYSAALAVGAAAQVGVRCLLLDRPNPLGGELVEGPLVRPGYESFVGMWPLPNRHGLTIGEEVSLIAAKEGWLDALEVVEVQGWSRVQTHDQTGLAWVMPSPNMPTLDTARVYPGLCLLEGTNLNEGRGTTRPFELVGAPFIDPFKLATRLDAVGLAGITFRPVFYRPTFHKYAGQTVGGVALHVTDPTVFQPLRTGLHLLAAVRQQCGEALEWRTDVYEFVQDRLAIDLLFGGPDGRLAIDAGHDVDALWHTWQEAAREFEAARSPHLRYHG